MYSYKSDKFSKSKVIRLLKSIKKTDTVIKKNDSKFFIHYNLNSLIKKCVRMEGKTFEHITPEHFDKKPMP